MTSTDKGVIVVGQPKTGNHAVLAMLDGFGFERAEELDVDGGISTMPFEDQPNLNCYKRMEDKMKAAKSFITLPHAHIKAPYFPKTFAGKIIHITRDPRAVAVSGYHFFGSLAAKIDYYKAYFELWDFKNANDFAKHAVNGDFYAGQVKDYDDEWKKVATERGYDIIYISYEDLISDKASTIKKVADFLGIKDYKIDDVIATMDIRKTKERRAKKYDNAGQEFKDFVYRKGQVSSWQDELSPEVNKLFCEKFPDLK